MPLTENELNDVISNATSGNGDKALELFSHIVNKIVMQEISSPEIPNVYRVWKRFTGSRLIGNGTEYVLAYSQESVYPYSINGYLPSDEFGGSGEDELRVRRFDNEPISQIISNPTRCRIPLTLTRSALLSKMVSLQKLELLVAKIKGLIMKALDFYMTDKVFTLITGATLSKQITSTASDGYGAWKDFGVAMSETQKYSQDYVIDQVNYTNGNYTPKDEWLVFMSPKTYATYTMGIKPVIFNNKELALDKVINPNNVYCLPTSKFKNDVLEETTKGQVEFKQEPYIDDETIICISTKAISLKPQLDNFDSQSFVNNMTQFFQQNFWYVLDLIKFENAFKFKCANLNKLPNE